MAVVRNKEKVCAKCGKGSEQLELLGASYSSECGLDTRPSIETRKDFAYDVQICPHCGYSYVDISEQYDQPLSKEYLSIQKDENIDPTSKKLLLSYIVAFNKREYDLAFELLLKASWTLEDSGDPFYRNVMEMLSAQLEQYLKQNPDADTEIVLIDIQRRLGHFESAKEHIKSIGVTENDTANKLLAHQTCLINQADTLHHFMTEVV